MYDRFKVQFLGCNQWKAFLQVKTHLVAKYAKGTGSGTIMLLGTGLQNMLHQIEVLFHVGCKGCKG